MAGTLIHEPGVPLKRAQEILGHASDRTTLSVPTQHTELVAIQRARLRRWLDCHRSSWETFEKQLAP